MAKVWSNTPKSKQRGSLTARWHKAFHSFLPIFFTTKEGIMPKATRIWGAKALLPAALVAVSVLFTACGGGGSATQVVDTPPVKPLNASLTLDTPPSNGVAAGSAGVTPPNPVAQGATLSNTYTKSGNPGTVTAVLSGGACDGLPFAFATKVADTDAGGTVSESHPNVLLPAGGECAYTLKVQGSIANSDGSFPSDTRAYTFVVDSSSTDRVVILSASQNHSPVVYVRQDDNTFRKHVPKKDFTWTPGNCLLERTPSSATMRAAACEKIGEVDAAYYVVALNAVDWTLSQSAAQVAKLGVVAATTDMTYWAGVNELVANPTPELAVSVSSKGGAFTVGNKGSISFAATGGGTFLVDSLANLGSTKLFLAW